METVTREVRFLQLKVQQFPSVSGFYPLGTEKRKLNSKVANRKRNTPASISSLESVVNR